MDVLSNSNHERFAQAVAAGEKRGPAYVSVFGPAKGADQSASRLLKNAKVSARVAELRAEIGSKLLNSSIRKVNSRVEALQNRWEWLKAAIEQLRAERGMDLKDECPGGATGLLVRDYKGNNAKQKVYRIDTGLVALLQELRALEEQAARELGQWMDKSEVTVKDGDLAARLAAGRARIAKAKAA